MRITDVSAYLYLASYSLDQIIKTQINMILTREFHKEIFSVLFEKTENQAQDSTHFFIYDSFFNSNDFITYLFEH